VIAMQVRQQDRPDARRIDSEFFHRNQRRGATIDKQWRFRTSEEDTGLEATSASERVSGTDELNFDHGSLLRRLYQVRRSVKKE